MIAKAIELYRRNRFIHLPVYAITRGKSYRDEMCFLGESEEWSKEKMNQWQLERLREIIEYAYNHVPYYHKLYSDVGFEPGDLKSIDDMSKVPYITKNDIKENMQLFMSDEASRIPKIFTHTGGSTDKPMEFWLDKAIYDREGAYYDYYWRKKGYRIGQRCVVLRGARVNGKPNVICYYDQIPNYLIFDSSFVSNTQYLELYDKQIRKFKSKNIQAYPSSLYMLAKNYMKSNIEPPHFDFIFLSSENTYEAQLETIREVFKPKVISYSYGHTESVLLAFKHQSNQQLGFMPQYGYCELVDDKGYLITDDLRTGEIVGTSWSHVMPFIRYKTGDYAQNSVYESNDFMSNCKTVRMIEGRKQEYIINSNGERIALVLIAGAHIPSLSLVGDMQYSQSEMGVLNVFITPLPGEKTVAPDVGLRIKHDLEDSLKNLMLVRVEIVDSVKRTEAGKRIMLLDSIAVND